MDLHLFPVDRLRGAASRQYLGVLAPGGVEGNQCVLVPGFRGGQAAQLLLRQSLHLALRPQVPMCLSWAPLHPAFMSVNPLASETSNTEPNWIMMTSTQTQCLS